MTCNHSSGLFLYAIFLSFAIGTADTIPASSCSHVDVQAAINPATDSDIVLVPEGTATWATVVTFNAKAITLKGDGTGKTVITAADDIGPVLSITGMEGKPFRISGFSFVLGTQTLMNVKGTCKNWRIDHCEFNADRGLVAII